MSYQENKDPAGKVHGIASGVVALVICFFLFPPIFDNSVGLIQSYSEANYGFGGGFIAFCWGLIIAACLFALSYLATFSAIWLLRSKTGG